MMKKRNQSILCLLEQNSDPKNDENIIDFLWSEVQVIYEEDIALTNFIESS